MSSRGELPAFDDEPDLGASKGFSNDYDDGDYGNYPDTSTATTADVDVEMEDADSKQATTPAAAAETLNPSAKVRVAARADSTTVDELKQKAAEAKRLEAKRQQEAAGTMRSPLSFHSLSVFSALDF